MSDENDDKGVRASVGDGTEGERESASEDE